MPDSAYPASGQGEAVWLNGSFGVGKTQTAFALRRRLPGSFVCDPEQLGFGLHRMTLPELRGIFRTCPCGGGAFGRCWTGT